MLRQLEELVYQAPVAAWLKLRDGRFLAFSRSFAQGLGVAVSAAPRTWDEDCFPGVEVKRFREHDRRVTSAGRPDVLLEPPDSLTPEAWGATVKIPIRGLEGATVGFSHSLESLLPLERLLPMTGDAGAGVIERSVTDRLRSHLDRQFQEQVRVSDLARALRRNPDHLGRCFRSTVGATIHKYVTARRVAWAAGRLIRTDRSLVEVALEAGFYDQSHMTRAFGAILGTTPARYRRLRAAPDRFRRLAEPRSVDALDAERAALHMATLACASSHVGWHPAQVSGGP